MSALTDAAAAALEASRRQAKTADLVGTARATLARVLGPSVDVAGLRVADTDAASLLAVLTDGVVTVAVTVDDTVALVRRDGAEWTRLADVASLAELGEALARAGGEG
jgi:hypothetical protein